MKTKADLIKEKVEKLLTMASHPNSNKNEAERAAELAERLIAQYNLDMDLSSDDALKIIEVPLSFRGKTASTIEKLLASVVQSFTGVKVIISSGRFIVIGSNYGSSCFSDVYTSSLSFFDKGWKSYSQTMPGISTEMKFANRRSYEKGFAVGIKTKLDYSTTALALIPPVELENYVESRFRVGRAKITTTKDFCPHAYSRGVADGSAIRNRLN